MAYYKFNLVANKPIQAAVRGRLILVDDIGVASGIDITPMLANQEGKTMPARKKAFKFWTDYDALILQSDVDTTVALFLSDTDVSLGFADGAAVNVSSGEILVTNDNTSRVPVEIGGSTVTVTADNVGINNTDANPVPVQQKAGTVFAMQDKKATVIVDAAPVNAGLAAVVLVNDPTLRAFRVQNGHSTARIALGGAAVTLANAAIVLEPGDVWSETDAPGAGWYVISDTAATPVMVQGLK